MPHGYPERIVCLTEETTETLYLLGEDRRIVGISGFTVRPPRARREKPRVSAFTSAKIDRIRALEPDLVLGFSDLQADIAAELARAGIEVHLFNHRSIVEILRMIRMLGGMIGCEAKAAALADRLEAGVEATRKAAAQLPRRPRVYFEEWDEPLISGIRWVEELVEIAGGEPVFPDLRTAALGKDRIIPAERVITAAPDVFIGSWCGKPVRKERVRQRTGWESVPFIVQDRGYEVTSPVILPRGPAARTEGVRQIHALLCRAAGVELPGMLAPAERWDDGGRRPTGDL